MCPHLEMAERRCGEHLTLNRLDHALHYCACDYQQCPVFQAIQYEQAQALSEQRRNLGLAG